MFPGGQTIAAGALPRSSTWMPAEQMNSSPERSTISGAVDSSSIASPRIGAASSSRSPSTVKTWQEPSSDAVRLKTSVSVAPISPPLSHTSGPQTVDFPLRPSARHEHVLTALLRQRLSFEAPVDRLDLEAGDIDEPEPLVLRRP